MPDLSTRYMGLTLSNPLIVGSSSLTSTVDKVAKCEAAGAGAVVLKSLFEEQILAETEQLVEASGAFTHTEALDYIANMEKERTIGDYLDLVADAKKRVAIPVIPSLNCSHPGNWVEYATRLEKAGADAIEINYFVLPGDPDVSGTVIDGNAYLIIEALRKLVTIPIALKVGSYFSGLANTMVNFAQRGVDALVLFNRLYRPDIDIEKRAHTAAAVISSPDEVVVPLRWIGLLHGHIECELVGTTGVHTGKEVVKMILAGAQAVQVVSALYQHGVEHVGAILREVEEWMERHDVGSLDEVRGTLSAAKSKNPEQLARAQYVKALVGIE